MRISDWSSDVCSSDLRHRSRFQKALPRRDAQFLQSRELRFMLDALGHNEQPERAGEVDDRAHDDAVAVAAVDGAGEAAVDLQIIDRQPREQRQAGITGAEIVEDRKSTRLNSSH